VYVTARENKFETLWPPKDIRRKVPAAAANHDVYYLSAIPGLLRTVVVATKAKFVFSRDAV